MLGLLTIRAEHGGAGAILAHRLALARVRLCTGAASPPSLKRVGVGGAGLKKGSPIYFLPLMPRGAGFHQPDPQHQCPKHLHKHRSDRTT